MRITGGKARGIPLLLPKGDAVRPATDAMRQAVFSSIASRVEGAWFLDLFAGSGAYGLEALSRGAAGGWFVEKNAKTAAFIRQNVGAVCKSLGRGTHDLQVLALDATQPPAGLSPLPELIFIDPPYDTIETVGPALLAQLAELLAPVPDPVVAFEMPGAITMTPPDWKLARRLGQGARQPTVCLFTANRAPPGSG